MTRYDGKTTRRRLKKVRISEISIVDQPAHTPARVAILKRRDDVAKNKRALTTSDAGHAHSLLLIGRDGSSIMSGETSLELAEDGTMHTHPWVANEAGEITVGMSHGHIHGVAILVKNQGVDDTPETDDNSPDQSAESTGESDTDMTKQTEPDPKDAVQKQIDELTQSNERLAQIVALSPEQRSHFEKLADSDKDEFLSKSSDERDAVVKNARDADPIVFEDKDAGIVLRKSSDPTTIALAKQAKESRVELARERALRKRDDLEKRAGTEFPNMRGETGPKADLLGAVEQLPEEARGPVMEMLKAHDAGLGKAFERIGDAGAPDPDNQSASDRLDSLAKSLAKEKDITHYEAYDEVLKTDEGKTLYAQHKAQLQR